MTSVARTPDEVLDELGAALDAAWRADRRRLALPRIGRRGILAATAAALLLVPTAVGTRNALLAPDPPPLPPQLRPRDAVQPGAGGTPVYVAAGARHGVSFRLSATTCRYGALTAVGLFLTVPGGGAGARCDVAARRPGADPRSLAARRVQTYYDPASGLTWAFGAVPPEAASIAITSRPYGTARSRTDRVAAAATDPRAVAEGQLPAGLRTFVIAWPGGRDVASVRVLDHDNNVILTCLGGRCAR
jgi:hypothetical protein